MADNRTSGLQTVAQKNETILILGVIGIIDQAGALVQKRGFGLLKRDAVLDQVGFRFAPIPGELDIAHSIILAIRRVH